MLRIPPKTFKKILFAEEQNKLSRNRVTSFLELERKSQFNQNIFSRQFDEASHKNRINNLMVHLSGVTPTLAERSYKATTKRTRQRWVYQITVLFSILAFLNRDFKTYSTAGRPHKVYVSVGITRIYMGMSKRFVCIVIFCDGCLVIRIRMRIYLPLSELVYCVVLASEYSEF